MLVSILTDANHNSCVGVGLFIGNLNDVREWGVNSSYHVRTNVSLIRGIYLRH